MYGRSSTASGGERLMNTALVTTPAWTEPSWRLSTHWVSEPSAPAWYALASIRPWVSSPTRLTKTSSARPLWFFSEMMWQIFIPTLSAAPTGPADPAARAVTTASTMTTASE
jgi:hypothetical protein